MANYDYREYDTKMWVERYPVGLTGITEWREQRSGVNWQGLDPVKGRSGSPARGALTRPRIFVSHRRIDLAKAERIAWLADQEGLQSCQTLQRIHHQSWLQSKALAEPLVPSLT